VRRYVPDDAGIGNAENRTDAVARSRAAHNDHDEIAAAASRLLDHLDAVAADR
jgi:hypothetical protein